jgi:hypothetical protein
MKNKKRIKTGHIDRRPKPSFELTIDDIAAKITMNIPKIICRKAISFFISLGLLIGKLLYLSI